MNRVSRQFLAMAFMLAAAEPAFAADLVGVNVLLREDVQ
jgi:hypothetical protein